MCFSLKNVSSTYQRLMDKVFKDLLEKNIEVYIDNMVIKSFDPSDHLKDSAEIFTELR